MKKILMVLVVALSFPLFSHAEVELGINVPGISLHIGDQDRRGYYWDGDYWRDPGWWSHHREERGRWVWIDEPRYYDGPPPRHWREPPRYYREGSPHWHGYDGPDRGRGRGHDRGPGRGPGW